MNIVLKAEQFVFDLFKDKVSASHIYHNFLHTSRVYLATKELVENLEINNDEAEIVYLAAWFHDCGFSVCEDCNEGNGAQIARQFLTENQYPEDKIKEVERLILATYMPQEPVDLLEQIIKDADTSHFADENYIGIAELLRAEWELIQNREISEMDWFTENRNLLLNHHRFYTTYAKENWQKQKEINIIALQKKLTKLNDPTFVPKEKKKEKDEKKEYSRAIDTMFRVTLNNHTRLSGIADTKANILLSVNAIIISIVLSTLIPKLDAPRNHHLIIPTFVLLMSSVISIIFAILSTRPKVTSGSFTREEVEQKKVNILFFGNFYKMPLPEYEWAMDELMKDRDGLYNTLTKDLYYLGIVLNKKYKLLRITYGIFMTGIILSVIAFTWAFVKYGSINAIWG